MPADQQGDDEDIDDAVNWIERLAMQQRAGRVFSLNELTAEEWDLLILWAAQEQVHEAQHRMRIQNLFEALLQQNGTRR